MSKLQRAVHNIHLSDDAGQNHSAQGGLHPLSRVLVTFMYILAVVSYPRYDWLGLAGMVLYLLLHIIWYEISVETMFRTIWPVLLLTAVTGIANPLLDREVYVRFGDMTVSYGMVSMLTLMIKGLFCVTASYILAVTAGIRQICHALRLLHIPKEIVTLIMLMHRYLMVLLKEVERMWQAYRLRAPDQRGLRYKAWGSFVGLLLLRSMDRAQEVYESMKLRGFAGDMRMSSLHSDKRMSILYVLLWGISFCVLRIFPVFQIVGNVL